MFELVRYVLTNKDLDDSDCTPAPKVIICIFQNCKGRVDGWVEPYMQLAIGRMDQCKSRTLGDSLFQVRGGSSARI